MRFLRYATLIHFSTELNCPLIILVSGPSLSLMSRALSIYRRIPIS